jgi:purine nucleosidase
MRALFLFFCISILCLACGTNGKDLPQGTPAREKVILDTDTTAFEWSTWDLEDDIAVLFALADEQLDIKGLTITYGNGTQEQTYRDALHLMSLTAFDIPVLPGADWETRDMARSTRASQFIIDTALAEAEGISLIVLGAMTNVAAALVQSPEIVDRINRILIMGGNLEPHWTGLSLLEVNFSAHPEATNVVFNTPVPKTLLPTETCIQTVLSREQLDQIHAHPQTVIYQFVDRMEFYHRMWSVLHDLIYPPPLYPQKVKGGFIPWDSITVAYANHPQFFSQPQCYGVQMINGTLQAEPCDELGDHTGKVTVPMLLDREGFDRELMDHVLSIIKIEPEDS